MKFVRKRWHGIPIAILLAVLALALATGGVFAAYNLHNATVNVTVEEPFTFGVNYVGWEAPPGADMIGGYYSQSDTFTCSVALMAGESSHGNPTVAEEIRDLMPILTLGETPAVGPPPWPGLHTFNSMQVANDAGLPIAVSFTVAGETEDVFMVVWEYPDLYRKLDGYAPEVPGDGFIMRGIGVVARDGAVPSPYSFTVTINRG